MHPVGLLIFLLGAATTAVIVKKSRASTPVIPEEPSPQGVDLHCWNCGYDFTAPLDSDVHCPNCNALVFDLETGLV